MVLLDEKRQKKLRYKIEKYCHYTSTVSVNFWLKKKSFSWYVKFDETARYPSLGKDDGDINKLIGICLLPWWYVLITPIVGILAAAFTDAMHKDSLRFGWRYNRETDEIELYSYCYHNSERAVQYLTSVKIGEWFNVNIDKSYSVASLWVVTSNIMSRIYHKALPKNKTLAVLARPYFGGNKPAPNDITITII